MFLHTTKIRKIITLPTNYLDDPNLSLEAKGLYTQLYYSNDRITALKDLTDIVNSSEEQLKKAFNELTEYGYVTIKNDRCDLQQKAVSAKSDKKTSTEDAEKYAETTQPKTLNKFEKLMKLIESYKETNQFSEDVVALLKVYFEKWMNKRGRFVEADDLHGYIVRAKIGDLISFHASDDEMINIIQQSIDKEWFKFVKPNSETATQGNVSAFDKTKLESGTYTQEEIDNILKRKQELESNRG